MTATVEHPVPVDGGRVDGRRLWLPRIVLATVMAGAAAALLGYFGFATWLMHGLVEEALPCEPSLILNTDTIIAPEGYDLYSDEEVATSKAYDACIRDSYALFEQRGVRGRAENVNWLLIGPAGFLATILLIGGWLLATPYGSRTPEAARRLGVGVMGGATAVVILSIAIQVRYAQTVNLLMWITE